MYPSIQMVSGAYFDFSNPEAYEVDIEDIAWALALQCRFTGHCAQFYSVAQHSVAVSRLVPEEYALQGLLHDAAEAFIGDMASPLKQYLPQYKELEGLIEDAIRPKLGLPLKLHPSVKEADLVMLATERRDLMPMPGKAGWEILEGIDPLPTRILLWEWQSAYSMFIQRYKELTDGSTNMF